MVLNKKVVLAAGFISRWLVVSACAAERPEDHLITVIGEAEVRVVPDQVVFTLGIESWDKDINVAKKANEDRVRKLIDLAKNYGIEPKHIQTDYIHMTPSALSLKYLGIPPGLYACTYGSAMPR